MSSTLQLPSIEEQEDDSQVVTEARDDANDRGDASSLSTNGRPEKQQAREAPKDGGDDKNSASLHKLSDFLFSVQHLRLVIEDQDLFQAFESFLNLRRPKSISLLSSCVSLKKALRSVQYADRIMARVPTAGDTTDPTGANCIAMPWVIQDRIDKLLDTVVLLSPTSTPEWSPLRWPIE